MTQTIPEPMLRQLSDLCAERLGLSFPRERWTDLERGILSAAPDFNFSDSQPFIQSLISSPLSRKHIEILASHLTVGETYFYRDKGAFEALEEHVLPELIRAHSRSDKRLRIWSAGCSTGEEAYSIAIAIRRAIPDLKNWNVTILATDVNPGFLKKASRGSYGEWSFRDGPQWVKEGYFTRTGNGRYQILPDIKEMVSFSYLNLAEDAYPSLLNNTNAMDLLFCRNVLMYLTLERGKEVVQNLYEALVVGGWIFVSPSEASHVLFRRFARIAVSGAILYRKEIGQPRTMEDHQERKDLPQSVDWHPQDSGITAVIEPARKEEPLAGDEASGRESPESTALLARAFANQGRLTEARQSCEKALAADTLDPGLYYLRAMILQEQGIVDEAISSLKRALYLDQDFALVHFALGNIARKRGRLKEAARHFENSLSILAARPEDELVPESGGITVARLREIVESTIASGGGK